ESGLPLSASQAAPPERGALEGLTFVVTGKLERHSRSEAEGAIRERGGKVSGSVNRKTRAVVAGEAAGSKLARALALNVPVLDENEFERLLAEGPTAIESEEQESTPP
ncbi:MAG: BRCT domain-containing protein, partial [Dehalococcoidia bacterium]